MQPSHDQYHSSNSTHTTGQPTDHHPSGLTGQAGLNLQNNPNHPHDNVIQTGMSVKIDQI
jgi:hypothetical protein